MQISPFCYCLFTLFCALLLCAEATNSITYEAIAQFVTVDYLWTANNSRSIYEETGQFVVANNAIAGVKVSKSGDIFVTVPRWMSGVPATLNQLVTNPNGPGYVLNPWPSWEFNALNTSGSLQNSQSMVIDSTNKMWIIEVGRTNFYDANPSLVSNGPAGIFVADVTTGDILSSYYFPDDVVPYNNSFVNDIVLDETSGFAYLTNTWDKGGIIVYDSAHNVSKMFVGPSTCRNYSYDFCANGVCYGTDGIGASPSDGIALSPDATTLYYSPVQGQGLFSIAVSILQNFSMGNDDFNAAAVFLGLKSGCNDGLLLLNNVLYFGNIQDSSLGSLSAMSSFTSENSVSESMSVDTAVDTSALHWVDTFSIDFNDTQSFYFTSNKLDLFMAATMDFTGQSGANFQVFHASVVIDDSSSNHSDGTELGLVICAVVLMVAVASFFGLKMYGMRNYGNRGPVQRSGDTDSSSISMTLNNMHENTAP